MKSDGRKTAPFRFTEEMRREREAEQDSPALRRAQFHELAEHIRWEQFRRAWHISRMIRTGNPDVEPEPNYVHALALAAYTGGYQGRKRFLVFLGFPVIDTGKATDKAVGYTADLIIAADVQLRVTFGRHGNNRRE